MQIATSHAVTAHKINGFQKDCNKGQIIRCCIRDINGNKELKQ